MRSNAFEISLGETALTFGAMLPLMYAASWKGTGATLALVFTVNMLWRIWVSPILRYRKLGTYDAKLQAQHDEIVSRVPNADTTLLMNAIRGRQVWPVLLIMLLWVLSTSYLMGGREARTRWEHYVKPGSPELVVLRIYGDTALAAPFDRAQWKLGAETHIIKLEGDVTLRLENLGALKRP
jgi:hypothetical protein